MKMYLICVLGLLIGYAAAQRDGEITPKVTTLTIEEGVVTPIHLSPGYATSVRVPDDIESVVLGNPGTFMAEHSEAQPRVLFLKPIVSQPAESNVLIITRSGQEISLHLISDRHASANSHVDFTVEYRRPRSVLIQPVDAPSFEVGGTRAMPRGTTSSGEHEIVPDMPAILLIKQIAVASPGWQGRDLQVAMGESREEAGMTVLSFSVLNHSGRSMDLMSPRLELSETVKGRHGGAIKSEPVPIEDCRITARKLAAGTRVDGVIVFRRPAYKESKETLLLAVSAADAVDRPVILQVPFMAPAAGGQQQ